MNDNAVNDDEVDSIAAEIQVISEKYKDSSNVEVQQVRSILYTILGSLSVDSVGDLYQAMIRFSIGELERLNSERWW
jgi:hypothetical protein